MMDFPPPLPTLARYAIMVDVGYIYAAAGELLFSAASRREYRVDADKLIQALTRQADSQVRGELLRVYWYDAARDRVPTIDQRVIAQMAWVKLRLGNLNARGQQKGVDAQIRADMEALARHRAITDAVLVAGDEDMVPAVEAAQAFGVRVHLWGVEPPFGTNQAERLVWESDTVEVLDRVFLEPYFSRQAVPTPDHVPPSPLAGSGRPVAGAAVRRAHRPARPPLRAGGARDDLRRQARPGPGPGRGGGRARRAEMDPHPGRGQHPRPAAGADPAAGHRQGTAGGRGEGARPVAAPLPGGEGVAPGRVLGPGPAAVRHRHRAPVTGGDRAARRTGGDLPADPAGQPLALLKVVSGQPSPEELAALTVAVAAVLARPGAPAGQAGRVHSCWADRSRLPRVPPRPGPDAWRRSARPG